MFKKSIPRCALAFSLSNSESEENKTTLGSVSVAGSSLLINYPSLSKSDSASFSFYLMARISATSVAKTKFDLTNVDNFLNYCSKKGIMVNNTESLRFNVSEDAN